ncbi:MAG: RteC domain-containing protein [Bacteroidetes bacterium]|nr:RteC domain-containing protein [Bacteroidota bacterium]
MNEIPTLDGDGNVLSILQEIVTRITAIEHLLYVQSPSNSLTNSNEKLPSITWSASKTDLIELIYGLYANRVFNNGKTTIKEITHFFEEALGVKLGNTSLRFQEILRRKDSIAFLDQVRDALETYMARIDDKTRT